MICNGYAVDVGVVKIVEAGMDGKPHQKSCEIDFIASKGIKKYYIQQLEIRQNLQLHLMLIR